jgi:hypothetical protein
MKATIDTVTIEADVGRLTIVWRTSRPIKRNIFEVAQLVVGQMSRAWWRAAETGKTYYPSLEHAINMRRQSEEIE